MASREFTGILSVPVTRGKGPKSLWFLPCELGNSQVVAAFLLLRLEDDLGQPGAIHPAPIISGNHPNLTLSQLPSWPPVPMSP